MLIISNNKRSLMKNNISNTDVASGEKWVHNAINLPQKDRR